MAGVPSARKKQEAYSSRNKYQGQFEPFDDQKLQTLLVLNTNFSETGSLEEKECFDICCEEKGG